MSAIQVVRSGAMRDRLPISRLHRRTLRHNGAIAALDGFDVYLAGGALAAMLKKGFSTLAQNAIFISMAFFGMLISVGFARYLGDQMGRRRCGRAGSMTMPYLPVCPFEQFSIQGMLWRVTTLQAALNAAILILSVETAKLSFDNNGAALPEDEALATVGAATARK